MRHKVTDPLCVRFAGIGRVRFVLGLRLLTLRRILFDRGRGYSCAICASRRGFRADRALRTTVLTSEYYFGGRVPPTALEGD